MKFSDELQRTGKVFAFELSDAEYAELRELSNHGLVQYDPTGECFYMLLEDEEYD